MTSRMRIVLGVPDLRGGGAERFMVNLANCLASRAKVSLLLGRAQGPYLGSVGRDVDIVELGHVRIRSLVSRLLVVLRKMRPAVFMGTLGMGAAAAILRPMLPARMAVIMRLGNTMSPFLEDVSRKSMFHAFAYRQLHRLTARMADATVAQSDYMLSDYRRNVGNAADRTVRIYNPVNVHDIEVKASGALPTLPGYPRIIVASRLYYQKGVDLMLKAMPHVLVEYPEAHLTILGDGPERSALILLARDIGIIDRVTFCGFEQNPYATIASGDVFVLPSRYEGFSNVLLEAGILGVVRVATDCPSGNREVVEHGVTGWLVKPDDFVALAEGICNAVRTPPTLSLEEIRQEIIRRFDLEVIAIEYMRLFELIVQSRCKADFSSKWKDASCGSR